LIDGGACTHDADDASDRKITCGSLTLRAIRDRAESRAPADNVEIGPGLSEGMGWVVVLLITGRGDDRARLVRPGAATDGSLRDIS